MPSTASKSQYQLLHFFNIGTRPSPCMLTLKNFVKKG